MTLKQEYEKFVKAGGSGRASTNDLLKALIDALEVTEAPSAEKKPASVKKPA